VTEQLALFDAEPNGNGHRMTKAEAGLSETRPGAQRLLGELVRRGLDRDHLTAAAALVLELDRPSNGDGHG
jgi:hypothetical protein